jgi:hypothetical protein
MTVKELKLITDKLDDSTVVCVPDMYIGNNGEVSYLEIDYVTTPCSEYFNSVGKKISEINDLLVIW